MKFTLIYSKKKYMHIYIYMNMELSQIVAEHVLRHTEYVIFFDDAGRDAPRTNNFFGLREKPGNWGGLFRTDLNYYYEGLVPKQDGEVKIIGIPVCCDQESPPVSPMYFLEGKNFPEKFDRRRWGDIVTPHEKVGISPVNRPIHDPFGLDDLDTLLNISRELKNQEPEVTFGIVCDRDPWLSQ